MSVNGAFLEWLARWEAALPTARLAALASPPERVAILCVDMTNAFCCEGPLASPRVAGLVPAIAGLLGRAHALGVRHFLFPQDTHAPDAVEFGAFPPHAVSGSTESQTVADLANLPFADRFVVLPKNSISSNLGTALEPWLGAHPEVTTFIVSGDCTDLCIYQAAMFLRLRANVLGLRDVRVVVPADCVQTYDLSVEAAATVGALPHAGDLLHRVFLYHMALNAVEVYARLE
jgi:nicotinamidase-related amidase